MKYKLTVMSLNIYMLQENKSMLALAPTTTLRPFARQGGGGRRTGSRRGAVLQRRPPVRVNTKRPQMHFSR